MVTAHHVVFGNCRTMRELRDESMHLVVTSPPYYNAPFDYPGLFRDYDEFLELVQPYLSKSSGFWLLAE